MTTIPKGGEVAGRLRAARGYSGLSQEELAGELGISVETLSRMENGRTTVSEVRQAAVADACEVPPAFFDLGFEPLRRPMTDAELRLLSFEAVFERRLAALEDAAAGGVFSPPPTDPAHDPGADFERELEEAALASQPHDDGSEEDVSVRRQADP